MSNNIKLALSSPKIKLCVPEYNAELCIKCAKEAELSGADVIVFPELALTGVTAGDLFFHNPLLEAARSALLKYVNETKDLKLTSFIGLPLLEGGVIYNTVAIVREGKVLNFAVSKKESRHFDGLAGKTLKADFFGAETALSENVIYTDSATRTRIFVKIGDEDAILSNNIDLILNPTAMPEYVGLSALREEYASAISRELKVAYATVGAGVGESGTDGIYAGARLVTQNGRVIAASELFGEEILYAEFDIENKEVFDAENAERCENLRFPFIPSSDEERKKATSLAVEIQARSLALRMERAYAKCAVIGVSGGLDSTLAVLVAAKAADILKRDRKTVIAITMPCFGTTERTKSNALALAEELGCSVRTIDIKASVNQHFADISHKEDNYDVVYENAQARERTQILMDVANAVCGIVIGTGDLSELALGFATYNGDHMSMYSVNGSVPKTFMREIIRDEAERYKLLGRENLSRVLIDVVETPVSPELLPVSDGENKQHTERIVGPYELHDFFIYHMMKYRRSPRELFSLAKEAFSEYSVEEIKRYLEIFIRRFFSQQFKRSCLPDGPRVTEISLSPRGAWQMPSDVSGEVWLNELRETED